MKKLLVTLLIAITLIFNLGSDRSSLRGPSGGEDGPPIVGSLIVTHNT